ncbi:hypothetical protein PUNSTDRAFT_144011 [Punctularia strigosozonata HHB-11173 SS5]|uniref:uncharacterized protein n=1 Tax=Punctularia strigosozonata (strain HHB-11173) TaxID=741275 RepID=UPI00044178B9|nr:uncharacterized protein PUNSTDRAFT_144011 [Punctularia strigosozonata HHB-11173 SS5]EIN08404.1 hypothetical protein PUNSTDRAFT_144011 [Punctularia strigosozonata HHB-11173 SS5]
MAAAPLVLQRILIRFRDLLPKQALYRILLQFWTILKSLWSRMSTSGRISQSSAGRGTRPPRSTKEGDGAPPMAVEQVLASRVPPSLSSWQPRRGRDATYLHVPSETAVQASRSSINVRETNNPYARAMGDIRHSSSPNIGLGDRGHRSNPHVPLEGIAVHTVDTLGIPATSSRPDSPVRSDASSVDIAVQSPMDDGAMSDGPLSHAPVSLGHESGYLTDGQYDHGYDVSPDTASSMQPGAPNAHNEYITTSEPFGIKAVPARNIAPVIKDSKEEKPVDYLRAHGIIPIDVSYLARYERGLMVPSHISSMKVAPMTLRFDREKPPEPWTRYIGPEGCTYFWHPVRRMLTDADLCDPETYRKIEEHAGHIMIVKFQYDEIFPENAEIVLELPHPKYGADSLCWYYCINHQDRSLFWLNEMDIDWMLTEVKGITKPSHAKKEMEAQYWTHWELFPMEREVSEELLQELIGMMMQGGIDQVTSKWSTFPYSIQDLTILLDLIKNANYVQNLGGYSANVVGRMMSLMAHTQFLNRYGHPEARLCRQHHLHEEEKRPPTLLITLFSPLLFFAPDIHLKSLRQVWVDTVVVEPAWKKFIEKVQDEWEKFLLPATVLLSVNVAFLAIPSVDQTNQVPNFFSVGNSSTFENLQDFDFNTATPQRSFAQIASYISTAASIGTIMIGLLLNRHHRLSHHMSAGEVANDLAQKAHPVFKLETLGEYDTVLKLTEPEGPSTAILYSLPYALMMWGMVTFAAACCALFFQNTTPSTQIPLGAFSCMCMVLIVWCMWTVWDGGHPWFSQLVDALRYSWIRQAVDLLHRQLTPKQQDDEEVQENEKTDAYSDMTTKKPSHTLTRFLSRKQQRRGTADTDTTYVNEEP